MLRSSVLLVSFFSFSCYLFLFVVVVLVWGMNVVWTMRSGMYMHNVFNILYADDDDQKTLAEELSGGV